MCDASDFAIGAGAVLGQRIDNRQHVIYYSSRTLNDAQQNYTTTEKEFLAVVFALEKFRPYLLCSKMVIFMDHSTKIPHDQEGRKSSTDSVDPFASRIWLRNPE